MQRQTKESLLLLPCRRRRHEMSTFLLVSSSQENITLSDWRQTVRGDLERKKERERERERELMGKAGQSATTPVT